MEEILCFNLLDIFCIDFLIRNIKKDVVKSISYSGSICFLDMSLEI